MTWMPNIPVALAAVDFEQKHADMLASARGVKAEVEEVAARKIHRLAYGVPATVTFPVYYFGTAAEGFNHWRDLWEASRKPEFIEWGKIR